MPVLSVSTSRAMAGRLSLGGFAAAGLIRSPTSSRASVTAAACRARVAAALRGSSSARRRFSEEWNGTDNDDASALLETIGDVDRAPQPLPPSSSEQAAVVRSVRDRVNVVCEAVAGSGKTTTVLHCARDVPDLTFMVLTYNARLKLTTRQRARELGLANVETHSFHACAARYYVPGCRDDETLARLVDEDAPPRAAIRFDCLVVDEAQDMTPLLHRFVLKVLRDAGDGGGPTQMLILGDSRQSIYQFRNADPRFLTMADRGVYALAEKPESVSDASESAASEATRVTSAVTPPAWRHHTLRTSFRASPRIASFVNDAMLGFACIKASPRAHLPDGGLGAPVTYMVGNAFQVASQEIADEIEYLLSPRGGGYAPDDIFVLTPSLKGAKLNSKTPLAQLENTLVMRCGVPVYVSLADEEELSDALTRGKICFTTFHSSKGLERPVVIVFGFSGDYFTYFARDAPKAVCPNTLYVAATRASERLYVVGEQDEGGKLPFLRLDPAAFEKWGAPLPPWLEVRRCGKLRPPTDAIPVPASSFAVTDLVKFLPEQTMRDATEAVEPVAVEPPTLDTEMDQSVPSLAGAGLIESVSDITGLAVVAAHEHRHGTHGAVPEIRDAESAHTTSLARRLQSSLAKMEQQLEANAAQRSARKSGDARGSRADLVADDVEAVRQMREVLASRPTRVRDFLKLASWYEAMEGGYLFRPFQLSRFDWVSVEAAAATARVLEKHLPVDRDNADARSAPARYEKRYDVSFRFGAPIVTIRGAADVVTAAGATGEIFEVKCVQRLLPEHLLQLALYQWLDAFAQIQGKIHRARERRRRMDGDAEKKDKNRAHRGFKGTGKTRREYTEEEAEDPLGLLDLFFDAGGDESKVMKRAVLLNARTGETVELRADLRALTGVVLTLVDQRIRTRVSVSDEVFLENAADAGAAIHAAAAEHAEGEGFVPTPAAFVDEAQNATFDPPKAAPGRAGSVESEPKPKPDGVTRERTPEGDVDGKEAGRSKRVPEDICATAAETKTTPKNKGRPKSSKASVPSGAVSDTIVVRGVVRACDAKRRVLTGGNHPRPRGRAPKGAPYWDSIAGAFAAADEDAR